jgi:3'-phosphoadenosine 5'-phosphosulfate sulfotransferase
MYWTLSEIHLLDTLLRTGTDAQPLEDPMHPYLTELLAEVRIRELHREAALDRLVRIAARRRTNLAWERSVRDRRRGRACLES